MAWYRWQGEDLILQLRVQPRARQDEFVEVLDDAMKLRLRAPPVDGKANAALIAFLAEAFGVTKRQVSLLQGDASRNKQVRIERPTVLAAGIAASPTAFGMVKP